MNPVPITETATDKLKEKLEIQLEINKLKSHEEIANNGFKNAVVALDKVKDRKEALEAEFKQLNDSVDSTVQLSKETVNECTRIVKQSVEEVAKIVEYLNLLEKKTIEEEEKTRKAVAEQERVHAIVVNENKILNTKKNDLDIYKKRLEMYFAEHLPDQKIVI